MSKDVCFIQTITQPIMVTSFPVKGYIPNKATVEKTIAEGKELFACFSQALSKDIDLVDKDFLLGDKIFYKIDKYHLITTDDVRTKNLRVEFSEEGVFLSILKN